MKKCLLIKEDGTISSVEVDGLEDMQRLVGGLVDVAELKPGIDIWFNDDGLALKLKPCFVDPRGDASGFFTGPCLVMGSTSDGESRGLTPEEEKDFMGIFRVGTITGKLNAVEAGWPKEKIAQNQEEARELLKMMIMFELENLVDDCNDPSCQVHGKKAVPSA